MTQNEKNLGLRLLAADTEAEVGRIIDSDAAMHNSANWHLVDGRETNYNVITNQATTGGKAATELVTNMVDAILTKLCLKKGIQPKSSDAPRTMYDAVDKFVLHLNGGKIRNADSSWVKSFAEENLIIGVTGPKGKVQPCYTFCDNGEGQAPKDFRDTFLSLSRKNKSEIPFVQGKYNMGSSGVLNFCGDRWFKLIVSRRYDGNTPWGWTLIRKRETEGEPCAEYFAPGNKIPEIGNEPIFPFQAQADGKFRFSLATGTIVKLYQYYIGKASGFRETREELNENLVETILPFRILDFRQTPDMKHGKMRALGIDDRPFCGLEFLVVRTHKEDADSGETDLESESGETMHIDTVQDSHFGKIVITAVVLKKKTKGKRNWSNRSRFRVFHHVNGQVHFKQMKGLFTQCQLPALKDRVVIFVDASRLNDSVRKSIWKGDRQEVLQTSKGEEYLGIVKEAIRRSAILAKLNHRIAKEEWDSAARDSSKELVQELLARDKNLMLLLDDKVPDVLGALGASSLPEKRNDLKHDPTYIKVKGQQRVLDMPVNRTRPIPCVTDAEDDFFKRAANTGYLRFSDDADAAADDFRLNYRLENGELVLFLRRLSTSNLKPGDKISFKIGMNSESMPQPVWTEEITVHITEKVATRIPEETDRDNTPPSHRDIRRGLPPYQLLTRDGKQIDGMDTLKWEDVPCSGAEFGEKDGGYVSDLGAGKKVYYINYENTSFQAYFRSQKGEGDKSKVSNKYILSMRILMLGLEYALASSAEGMGDKEDEYRRMVAKGAAAVALTVCDGLPKSFEKGDDPDA